jgi:lysyl-tRNA synthetase, class I
MFWADRIREKLNTAQHIDDMFTPSGYAHAGSLRGPILHDVVSRVLSEKDKKTVYTYVFNDFDPMDGLPPELMEVSGRYLGYPLRLAPSPDGKKRSFADFFADDFKTVLTNLGMNATYLSSWDMYHEGKFNDAIKTALENVEKIQNIYKSVSGSTKKDRGWYPLQVICPECKKLGTTMVTGWDGEKVRFKCEENMVSWATGCGFEGTISPFDGNAKLPWKVDWPAHWKVLGVTFEGAGKDHASRGGSYDIAFEECREVFDIPKPFYFPYEFFLFGGKKMASSKGIGLKARDITNILPPEVARFLIVRVIPNKALEFDPTGDTIPNLFDEFDRCAKSYWDNSDPDMARIYELSMVNEKYHKQIFLPRFKDVINVVQNRKESETEVFVKIKGGKLNETETEILNQRIKYAKIWIEKFMLKEDKNEISEDIPKEAVGLTMEQKSFLLKAGELLSQKSWKPDDLQQNLYELTKTENIGAKLAFEAIYRSLTGKQFGPKAGWFLTGFPKEKIINRFKEVQNVEMKKEEKKYIYQTLNNPELFSIDRDVVKRYPSINVGIAVIKGVKITQSNKDLDKETGKFVSILSGLTTETIGGYPEIKSYRKLYKETGIDWHSRRPSPEALLRRIAQGKGEARVNTCVDAYNLIVMKYRISVGAFNLDAVKFPTVLRFAKSGEKIHLMGEQKPTEYHDGEIAYFDKIEGYNMDFNYRDAIRTQVNETTTNLLINTEGIFDISREQVERTLKETIDMIIRFCGGKLELSGIVSASDL